jgi:2-keto-4-pentenoate hydratase/2-oxohepta-3-ene-1,7-dioic acid hydratase in catechol pathway
VKFASVRIRGVPAYGVVEGDVFRPVTAIFQARYPSLRTVLAAGALGQAAAAARANPRLPDPAEVAYDPVIPELGKILCVGVNYREHMKEMGRKVPDYPVLFTRAADSMVGHGCALTKTRVSHEYDYEGELAFVIGRSARYVAPDQALGHIAGYTCLMDGSVRDFQNHTSQFIAGKNFPGSGSVGPWLVTTEEIPDPKTLQLETRLNGQVMQRAPVSDMHFGVAELLAYCSTFARLEPGDIITTGTPSGVGFARKPPVWMKAGDVIEVEISGIGVLRNPVVDEVATTG